MLTIINISIVSLFAITPFLADAIIEYKRI